MSANEKRLNKHKAGLPWYVIKLPLAFPSGWDILDIFSIITNKRYLKFITSNFSMNIYSLQQKSVVIDKHGNSLQAIFSNPFSNPFLQNDIFDFFIKFHWNMFALNYIITYNWRCQIITELNDGELIWLISMPLWRPLMCIHGFANNNSGEANMSISISGHISGICEYFILFCIR